MSFYSFYEHIHKYRQLSYADRPPETPSLLTELLRHLNVPGSNLVEGLFHFRAIFLNFLVFFDIIALFAISWIHNFEEWLKNLRKH